MTKINLKDSTTTTTILTKMSEGNPGAAASIIAILNPKNKSIDPDAAMGTLAPVLLLDTLNIYGTDIYVLYNDICDRNAIKVFAVLRAYQLGFITKDLLKYACSKQDYSGKSMIDIEHLHKQVKEKLPNFADLNK